MAARKSSNGSSATRIELDLVREVLDEKFKPLAGIPEAVGKLEVQQAVMVEQLKHLHTPDNCPITEDVQDLQIAIRDSSHDGLANSTFRIQTKAIAATAVLFLTLLSSSIGAYLVYLVTHHG